MFKKPEKATALRRHPTSGSAWNLTFCCLRSLLHQEQPDIICIQEHKLQEKHVPSVADQMEELLTACAIQSAMATPAPKAPSDEWQG